MQKVQCFSLRVLLLVGTSCVGCVNSVMRETHHLAPSRHEAGSDRDDGFGGRHCSQRYGTRRSNFNLTGHAEGPNMPQTTQAHTQLPQPYTHTKNSTTWHPALDTASPLLAGRMATHTRRSEKTALLLVSGRADH